MEPIIRRPGQPFRENNVQEKKAKESILKEKNPDKGTEMLVWCLRKPQKRAVGSVDETAGTREQPPFNYN